MIRRRQGSTRPRSKGRRAASKGPKRSKRSAGASRTASATPLKIVEGRGKRRPAPAEPANGPRIATALRKARSGAGPRSFPQTASGSSRERLMFELVRARVTVHAVLQGLGSANVDEPIARGKWSAHQHVLHLLAWDRAALKHLESALRGIEPPWAGFSGDRLDAFNAEAVREQGRPDWETTLRRLHASRDELMQAVESIPDEPAEVWDPEHPLGAMLYDVAWNDRHHAEAIRRWRMERG